MKNFLKFTSVVTLSLFYPLITFAQVTFTGASVTNCTGSGVGKLICTFQQILNSVVPVLIALGVVYFVWGVVQYMIADGEEAKKKGKGTIIYGLIGFAVIVGLWGLVNMIVTTFDLGSSSLAPAQPTDSCTLVDSPKLGDFFDYVTCNIGRFVIPLIFSLSVVCFVWGVVQFVINSDEEAKRAKGKQFMIWGIIALAVMVSVWGLVHILGDTFNINTSVLPKVKP